MTDHSGTPSASPRERDEAICEVEGCGDWLRCLTHGVTFSRVGDMPASCADTTWMTPRALAARQRRAASVSVSEEGSATPSEEQGNAMHRAFLAFADRYPNALTRPFEPEYISRLLLDVFRASRSGIPTGSQSSATDDERLFEVIDFFAAASEEDYRVADAAAASFREKYGEGPQAAEVCRDALRIIRSRLREGSPAKPNG